MAGPGTFFGAPLMAGTTQFPTTNPSTGAVTPSNAGSAELTQQVLVTAGTPVSIAVPPGSIITNVLGVITSVTGTASAAAIQLGTASGGSQLAAGTFGTFVAGANIVGALTAASQNAATIANPGVIWVGATQTGATAVIVSVLVQYMPTVANLDSNF